MDNKLCWRHAPFVVKVEGGKRRKWRDFTRVLGVLALTQLHIKFPGESVLKYIWETR